MIWTTDGSPDSSAGRSRRESTAPSTLAPLEIAGRSAVDRRDDADDRKVRRARRTGRSGRGSPRAIGIGDHDGHVADVGGGGVAKNVSWMSGAMTRSPKEPRVLPELDKLLPDQRERSVACSCPLPPQSDRASASTTAREDARARAVRPERRRDRAPFSTMPRSATRK